MRILLTCGPASEWIDQVRRMSNHSTGELGARLATELVALGQTVRCIRGTGATFPAPPPPTEVIDFGSTAECKQALAAQSGWPDIVLHLAALADFIPVAIRLGAESWRPVANAPGKIPSATEELSIRCQRAEKVIGCLRGFFPQAFLVGWKYEVEGTVDEALAKGRQQIAAHDLQACVVNGPSCGAALYWLSREGKVGLFPHRAEFVRQLPTLLALGPPRTNPA